MVLGVLNQAFDVLVLRYGVQKRIYCNVSTRGHPGQGEGPSGQAEASSVALRHVHCDLGASTLWLLLKALPPLTFTPSCTLFSPACPPSLCWGRLHISLVSGKGSWPRDSPG